MKLFGRKEPRLSVCAACDSTCDAACQVNASLSAARERALPESVWLR